MAHAPSAAVSACSDGGGSFVEGSQTAAPNDPTDPLLQAGPTAAKRANGAKSKNRKSAQRNASAEAVPAAPSSAASDSAPTSSDTSTSVTPQSSFGQDVASVAIPLVPSLATALRKAKDREKLLRLEKTLQDLMMNEGCVARRQADHASRPFLPLLVSRLSMVRLLCLQACAISAKHIRCFQALTLKRFIDIDEQFGGGCLSAADQRFNASSS
eukprot:6207135-Pleurochrysis_carterae.AAC.1